MHFQTCDKMEEQSYKMGARSNMHCVQEKNPKWKNDIKKVARALCNVYGCSGLWIVSSNSATPSRASKHCAAVHFHSMKKKKKEKKERKKPKM